MSEIIGTATNKRIIELVNMMRNGSLILKPRFQRNLVWNDKHKENFIDTILKGFPFPEVYFADGEIDLETQSSTTLVVDGQQRLDTIYAYVDDDPKLVLKTIPRFSQLDDGKKTRVLDYLVVVRDLGRIGDKEIKEIFNRINSIQYALNAMEISNALYEGEFIGTAQEIIEYPYLKDLELFSESQSARMKDLEFILLVMTTVEVGGYFSANKEVEEYVKRYDNEYPYKDDMKNDIFNALRLVKSTSLSPDSIWLKKSSFFTLLVELIWSKGAYGSFPSQKQLKDVLTSLEEQILDNKSGDVKKNKYANFYNYVFQNTASRAARIARGNLLEEYLEKTN